MTWKVEVDADDGPSNYEGPLGFILSMQNHDSRLAMHECRFEYDCQWCTETLEAPNIEALMHKVIVQHMSTHFGGE